MTSKDKELFNRLMTGGEKFLLMKKYDKAYENYKSASEVHNNDLVKSKIDKLDKFFELKKQYNQSKSDYDYNKAMQLALKLVLNGTYGAFANRYFVLSNSKIANAITAMGRNVIQYMLEEIEEYFYFNWHKDKKLHNLLGLEYVGINKKDNNYYFLNREYNIIDGPFPEINTGKINKDILKSRNIPLSRLDKIDEYDKGEYKILYEYNICTIDNVDKLDDDPIWKTHDEKRRTNPDEIFRAYHGKNPILIYGDTDSVDSQTIIETNGGKIKIEELYNKNILEGSAGVTLKGHESVNCKERILNWDEKKKLYYAPVKRIIRHKVSKPKWKLRTKNGKEIIITNDHSMIVFRNNKKIEVKPSEILKTDKILIINPMNNILK